jgi:two-component system, NarL family, invasion response regulator UvrY
MKILIVDDHEVVRRGLKQILADAFPEASFAEAGTSQEALDQVGKQRWDIILLDINIPGRNGLEVLEEVHKHQAKTPVLILSAFPEQDFALRALKLGAAGYLTKQSASDELHAAVRKAIEGGKYVTASLAEKLAARLGQDLQQTPPHEALSNRELQILRMIASGKTIKEIAAELSLSEKTIATYRTRIAEKLNLTTNVEFTRYALKHRLVELQADL